MHLVCQRSTGDYAYYIDPYDYNIDLDNLIKEEKKDIGGLLEKYSWEKAAIQLKQVLDELREEK